MGAKEEQRAKTLPAGSLVAGRYRIEKTLGTGGMGSVYLAADEVLDGEKVAIKILHPDLIGEERQTQRFLREVQLMRRVNHPNVVRTFDFGTDDSAVYFTMEYVPGQPLEDMIQSQDLPLEAIPHLIEQICLGLEAIHAANIIHRDLKPANIIVLDDGTAKITDFGVARPEYSNLTAHNEIIGSALYIAPEVWLGTELTHRVDLYSLGVLLYELTTGVLPFEGDSTAALMRLHLEYEPPPPKSLNADIPVWLNKLILRLISKPAHDRPEDARAVIEYVAKQTRQRPSSTSSELFVEALENRAKEHVKSGRAKKQTRVFQVPKSDVEPLYAMREEILSRLACIAIVLIGCFGGGFLLNLFLELAFPELSSYARDYVSFTNAEASTFSVGSTTLFLLFAFLSWFLSLSSLPALAGALCGSLRMTLKMFLYCVLLQSTIGCVFFLQILHQGSEYSARWLFSAGLAVFQKVQGVLILDPFHYAWRNFDVGVVIPEGFYPWWKSVFSTLFLLFTVAAYSFVFIRYFRDAAKQRRTARWLLAIPPTWTLLLLIIFSLTTTPPPTKSLTESTHVGAITPATPIAVGLIWSGWLTWSLCTSLLLKPRKGPLRPGAGLP